MILDAEMTLLSRMTTSIGGSRLRKASSPAVIQ
jgi:hypothetical protein